MTLTEVVYALFGNKDRNGKVMVRWCDVSNEDKQKNFFIINRYLSKNFLNQSYMLNNKSTDYVTAMNIWKVFLDKKYAKDFWSKATKKESIFTKEEIRLLMEGLELDKQSDIDVLYQYFQEELLEELKYFKSIQKNKNKK